MGYQAIMVGATGAVGGALFRELVASPRCESVIALVRRPVDLGAAGKVRVEVVDLAGLEEATARWAAAAGVRHVSLLSALGANLESRVRYFRVKGAAEAAVTSAGASRTSLGRQRVGRSVPGVLDRQSGGRPGRGLRRWGRPDRDDQDARE